MAEGILVPFNHREKCAYTTAPEQIHCLRKSKHTKLILMTVILMGRRDQRDGAKKRRPNNNFLKDIKFLISCLSSRIRVQKRASMFRMTDFISKFSFNSQIQGKLIEKKYRYFFSLSYMEVAYKGQTVASHKFNLFQTFQAVWKM